MDKRHQHILRHQNDLTVFLFRLWHSGTATKREHSCVIKCCTCRQLRLSVHFRTCQMHLFLLQSVIMWPDTCCHALHNLVLVLVLSRIESYASGKPKTQKLVTAERGCNPRPPGAQSPTRPNKIPQCCASCLWKWLPKSSTLRGQESSSRREKTQTKADARSILQGAFRHEIRLSRNA